MKSSYDLFISYKSGDIDLASQVYERLIDEGFSVWFDKARLNPGCKWHAEIEAGCEASRIILPVLTLGWKDSEWTKFEAYGAEFVIPLLWEGDFEVAAPPPLHEFQFADFRLPQEDNWRKLFASIRQHLDQAPPQKTLRLASVPYAHNSCFVGREKGLLEVHETFCRTPSTALTQGATQIVSGLGGIGKTTLAREYAEKFWRLYHDVLWVRGDQLLVLEFQRLAEELGLIRERSKDPEVDARRALQELSGRTRRLLIIDNAPDEVSIQKWIPATGHCRTLVTSRFTGWSAAFQTTSVGLLESGPARELLLKRSGMPDSEENQKSSDRVAEELGYLPLALEDAAAFVQQASISFDRYLDHYTETSSRRDLTAKHVFGSTQYPHSVATTWLVTVQRLGPWARSILTLTAFLAGDDIPRSILKVARPEIRPPDGRGDAEISEYAIDKALAELNAFSMVTLRQESFSVHRLVQAVQRDGLHDSLQIEWAERAVRAINGVFPEVEYSSLALCGRLITHARVLSTLIDRYDFQFPEASRMLNQAGCYFLEIVQNAEAESFLKRALAIRERVLDAQHPDVAQGLNNLAMLYSNQGRYEDAETLLERALAIRKKILGLEHPDVALSLYHRAQLHYNRGQYGDAKPLFEQAASILEKVRGREHPDFASCLSGVALLLYNQGEFADAKLKFRQALETLERAHGAEHPYVAICVNNLGLVCTDLGEYTEAESHFGRARTILENTYGREHPDLAGALTNLGLLYFNDERYWDAESLFKQALAIHENAVGQDHQLVANSRSNLAAAYEGLSQPERAQPHYERALAIYEKALGEEHPVVGMILNKLGTIHFNQGRYAEAEPLLVRALTILEKKLGPEHSHVAISFHNLVEVYTAQGKHKEVKRLRRENRLSLSEVARKVLRRPRKSGKP